MSAPAKTEVLHLYHRILKAAARFQDYNFRETALRKAKHQFRAHRSCSADESARHYSSGQQSLAQLERIAVLQQLYPTPPYIIEQRLKAMSQAQAQSQSYSLPSYSAHSER